MDNPTDTAVEALAEELRMIWFPGGTSWKNITHNNQEDWRRVARYVLTLYPAPPEDARACIGRLTLRVNELRAELVELENTPVRAPTRSALDSALDPMLGNSPVRKAVVDAVLGLFENARRPLTEADVERITKDVCVKCGGATFEELSKHMQKVWLRQIRVTLAAASWPMTHLTDSAASDRLAWLEKTIIKTMDQTLQLIVEKDAFNGRVATLEAELAAAQMSATDLKNLDEVVAILGIEDSTTTPAEAVFELHKEIERLRRELAATPPPGTIRLGEGLTEAQEGWSAEQKKAQAHKADAAADAVMNIGWFEMTDQDAWSQIYGRLQNHASSLRTSATPKPEAVDWVKQMDQWRRDGEADYAFDTIIEGLCDQIAALRAGVV